MIEYLLKNAMFAYFVKTLAVFETKEPIQLVFSIL